MKKHGKYGMLYLYNIPYKERGDGIYGTYRSTARIWAYDAEDALDRFYSTPDADDWVHTAKPKRVKKKNPMRKSDLLDKIYNDDFLYNYFEMMLWSTTDYADETGGEALDENYSVEDIEMKSLKRLVAEAEDFLDYPGVREAIDIIGDYARAGGDFWLTREGHGAGFWDGDWPEPQASFLTDVAKTFGSQDLYVSRGKIYAA